MKIGDEVRIKASSPYWQDFSDCTWDSKDSHIVFTFAEHPIPGIHCKIQASGYGLHTDSPDEYGKGKIYIDQKYLELAK